MEVVKIRMVQDSKESRDIIDQISQLCDGLSGTAYEINLWRSII